jgi:predicted ATPase
MAFYKGVSMDAKQIIAMTGSHGTGKSLSASRLYRDYKINNPEQSAYLICDQEGLCPYPINKNTGERAQTWIFGNQLKLELEAMQRFDVVFIDRTIIDVVAYTWAAGFFELAQGMMAIAESHIRFYRTIYFKKIAYHNHCHPDGIRDAEDKEFRQAVEDTMLQFYRNLEDSGHLRGNIFYA